MPAITYYFNHLDAHTFQKLINAILVARFGESARLTPVFGRDGGRDGETAPFNPYFEYQAKEVEKPSDDFTSPPQKGRYLFQVKHHHTGDTRINEVRSRVISDFSKELEMNVLNRERAERVNYFFLITNVTSSDKALEDIDAHLAEIRKTSPSLHADVWWGERIEAFLNQMPMLWNSFPELFVGGKPPFLAEVFSHPNGEIPRAARLAIERQYHRDSNIKFQQIGLEKSLQKLFTGLDISAQFIKTEEYEKIQQVPHKKERFPQNLFDRPVTATEIVTYKTIKDSFPEIVSESPFILEEGFLYPYRRSNLDALVVLLDEKADSTKKMILEGGPGQGKSTITQMVAQIYRQQILHKNDMKPEGRWFHIQKTRLPFRIELRLFAEWISREVGESIEEYLAFVFKKDSGGCSITVNDIYNMVENSPVLLILDGLDEVGNDDLREDVLNKISECVSRFEENLSSDLRTIITTRPPAIAGCKAHLTNFQRFPLSPMEGNKIKEYVKRWISVQIQDEDDQQNIQESFEQRQSEPHVQALAKNPMQLSVLLHFIRFKGLAFPDGRAELYKEYFQTVIDRDIEKSAGLREQRTTVEALHRFLGYKIHALTEANQADGTLNRAQLINMVEAWLKLRGSVSKTAQELFRLGEERLGLIIALKGEGEETKYGFEIQPVREYFAAAFIDEDIKGDAHNIFELMVRRPYWREVSIFLAGLRRSNEKADLIARARSLDKDETLGWRQDGRKLVLQLLQEGVFSERPHVFSEALDFIFELLDPQLVKAQDTPKDLLRALPTLLKQDKSINRFYSDKLLKLLKENESSNDEYIAYRLFSLAKSLLPERQFIEKAMNYKFESYESTAKVRLLWPANWGIQLQEIVSSGFFWEGVPDPIWALFLRRAIENHKAETFIIPPRFHQYLAEQFATHPLLYPDRALAQITPIKPNLAIQLLLTYQELFLILHLSRDNSHLEHFAHYMSDKPFTINLAGLDEETSYTINSLISISQKLLEFLILPGIEISDHHIATVNLLKDLLKKPGLSGWLAARITLSILGISIKSRINNQKKRKVDILTEFLTQDLGYFFTSSPKPSTPEDRFNMYISHINFFYIRLENSNFEAVIDLIAKGVCGEKELPYGFLSRIPITTVMIHPLIQKCSDHLTDLLIYLSQKSFISSYPISAPILSLPVPYIQRILKIARKTNDTQILGGALVVLLCSKFLRLAKSELTLKLIRADVSKAALAANLFDSNIHATDDKSKTILYTIAEKIINDPENYSLRITTAAAHYLEEHLSSNQPSLATMEDDHNIHI